MDVKKAPYQIAYEERLKQIESGMETPHKGVEKSRDLETEIRPTHDSVQLGEGSHR